MTDFDPLPFELNAIAHISAWIHAGAEPARLPGALESASRALRACAKAALESTRYSRHRPAVRSILVKELMAGVRAGERDLRGRWASTLLASTPEARVFHLEVLAGEGILGVTWRGRTWGFTTWMETAVARADSVNRGLRAVFESRR